jgi:hypothetical protein
LDLFGASDQQCAMPTLFLLRLGHILSLQIHILIRSISIIMYNNAKIIAS